MKGVPDGHQQASRLKRTLRPRQFYRSRRYRTGLKFHSITTSQKSDRNGGSSMDEHRNFAMCEDLEGLAAEDQRGDAVAAVRSHDDQIAASQGRGIDNGLVGMLMLDLDRLACDAHCSGCVG